ncbi:hypothetical protein [Blattabacterium cuenoti]|uniref:hypothetical protein n=1 Tax=Blattabacterium cuenoti TaxID=1653831 RepID=UPI00163C7E54|nr:hypothetical protein [Blattabacterium cuenoti]
MNTSFLKFLIPTVFLSLGFLVSCNDDLTSNSDDYDDEENSEEFFNLDEVDRIDPGDLSTKIKDIGIKIEQLKKESNKHYDEYYELIRIQKEILNEVKNRRRIMRSKTSGSEERKQAKKDLDDQKNFGKEQLEFLKKKSNFLHNLEKSISGAIGQKLELQRKQDDFFKRIFAKYIHKKKKRQRRVYFESY